MSRRLRLAATMLATLAGGCQAPPPAAPEPAEPAAATPTTAADAEAEIVAAHQRLVRAWESRDTATLTGLMDSSEELLLFHPAREDRFDGRDEVEAGLGIMFNRLGEAKWTEVHSAVAVEGNVGWLTSHFLIESPRLTRAFVGRGTEIWVERDGGWRLVHAHWSQNPAPDAAASGS